jgi:serralysin
LAAACGNASAPEALASGAMYAGNGNVQIHVGGGDDTLTGGPGHDQFIFDTALAGQVDKITNFHPNLDKVVLSEAAFAGIGPLGHPLAAADFHVGAHATTTSQYIIYNAHTGFLFYDPHDGSPQIHFATLASHPGLTHADFMVVA